jgi:DNA adenine methylase
MTYDDCPEIRELYQDFDIIEWGLQYRMNNCGAGNKSKKGKELMIKNY